MTDIPNQIIDATHFNGILNIILTFQNAIYSLIVTIVATVIFLKILFINKRQEAFLLVIPVLIGLSNGC